MSSWKLPFSCMTDLRALIFDVDGTLADTESTHREAFNEAFEEVGLDWNWSEAKYTALLRVAGGKERLKAHHREVNGYPMPAALVERVHAAKTRRYVSRVQDRHVVLRPGVLALLEEARGRGLPLAIATTTSPENVSALLRSALGERWRDWFSAWGDASKAPRKKPDPQVYRYVLETLGLPASACLAFEDSFNGLTAALAAGIPTIITPTAFTAADDFEGARAVLPNLEGVTLAKLMAYR